MGTRRTGSRGAGSSCLPHHMRGVHVQAASHVHAQARVCALQHARTSSRTVERGVGWHTAQAASLSNVIVCHHGADGINRIGARPPARPGAVCGEAGDQQHVGPPESTRRSRHAAWCASVPVVCKLRGQQRIVHRGGGRGRGMPPHTHHT